LLLCINQQCCRSSDVKVVSKKGKGFSKEAPEDGAAAAATPFGGPSMSNEFKMWCSAQMQSLTGSEDLTLIEFLMSLSSPADIKEYVAQYLGPKVPRSFPAQI
jgi:hypothetical protein